MVFKKPYAFFIKYFRIINLILNILLMFYIYRLNLIHQVINDFYYGRITNFSNAETAYVGLGMYFLIFLISLLIIIIILTLKKKEKPFKDYLFNIIYNVFIIIYLFSVGNLFLTLNETVIEQTTLKLYSDISFLIILPLLYFFVKYLLIIIGFDLKKFNFQKDILEMKKTEDDNEEIELIFDRDTYKTKRKIRKTFREFKYYLLENKLIITIICIIASLIVFIPLFSLKIFDSNKVNLNKYFTAGNFLYKVLNVYETKYDSRYKLVNKDNKFVVAIISVRNNLNLGDSIDFKRIRLFYEDEYVYSNNFYNKYFLEFKPYDGEIIKSGEEKIYAFLFKVPNTYKSNKYIIKFYDRIVFNEDESVGSYKVLDINAKRLDQKRNEKELNLNESSVFNKELYGYSNITINNYKFENKYIYNDGEKDIIVGDNNINNTMLILDYNLKLDVNSNAANFIGSDKDFFENHVSLEYKQNNITKTYNNIKALNNIDEKIFLSVPYNVKNSDDINLVINFRDVKIIYNLK